MPYTDSEVQIKDLIGKDGSQCGSIEWKTRYWTEKDGEKNVNEVIYDLKPKNRGNVFDIADWNGKEFEVYAGPVSPRGYVPGNKNVTDSTSNGGANRADYCKIKISLKQNGANWEWEKREVQDGNLDKWSERPENEKWNFQNDDGQKQNCKFGINGDEKTMAKLNFVNNTFSPEFTWSKRMKSGDGSQDIQHEYNDSMPFYWNLRYKDQNCQGKFEGFFLDDPLNPTLSNAKALVAGFVSSAALVYSVLA